MKPNPSPDERAPRPRRRRFLSICAASAATLAWRPSLASGIALQAAAQRHAQAPAGAVGATTAVWKGTAMGALASITLVHEDASLARATLARCADEIERLEAIFSLYRPDSAISRLNAAGVLRAPPGELVELLSVSLALARASGGAFDPTIQPLYRLYQSHFSTPGAAPAGPGPAAIAQTLAHVDHRRVDVSGERIALGSRGMAITLNGVAQGCVTDRVADLLRREGFTDVVVDLGEARAAGRRADGRAWTAAIVDPETPSRTLFELTMGDAPGQVMALATSAGAGTRFGSDPRVHHLFDPHTGRSANRYASVSVAASRATIADGLSTALSIVAREHAAALLAAHVSARAWFVRADGAIETLPAG